MDNDRAYFWYDNDSITYADNRGTDEGGKLKEASISHWNYPLIDYINGWSYNVLLNPIKLC